MLSEGPVDVLVVDLELSSLSRHGIISFLYMKRALRRVLSFWFFITLNSNLSGAKFWVQPVTRVQTITLPPIVSIGLMVGISGGEVAAYGLNSIRCNKTGGSTSVAVAFTTDGNQDGQTLTRNDPNEANFTAMLIYR